MAVVLKWPIGWSTRGSYDSLSSLSDLAWNREGCHPQSVAHGSAERFALADSERWNGSHMDESSLKHHEKKMCAEHFLMRCDTYRVTASPWTSTRKRCHSGATAAAAAGVQR